jgi:hypothetical protein
MVEADGVELTCCNRSAIEWDGHGIIGFCCTEEYHVEAVGSGICISLWHRGRM